MSVRCVKKGLLVMQLYMVIDLTKQKVLKFGVS